MHATRIFRVASVCHLFGHIPAVPCICHKILVRGTPLFNSWQYFWHFRRLLGRWPWWIAIGFFDWAIFRLGIWLGSWGKGIGVSTPQPFWHESTAVTEIPLYAKFPLVRAVESTRSPRWRSSLGDRRFNAPAVLARIHCSYRNSLICEVPLGSRRREHPLTALEELAGWVAAPSGGAAAQPSCPTSSDSPPPSDLSSRTSPRAQARSASSARAPSTPARRRSSPSSTTSASGRNGPRGRSSTPA